MQPIGSVIFNLFNLDPARANPRSRGVQSQGRDQSDRRVHENKDAMPSIPRDAPSTSAHKTGGWISSLNLGNTKPVLLISTLVNQFSPLFGRAIEAVDTCSPAAVKATMGRTVVNVMTSAGCSAEATSEILKDIMKAPAEDGNNCDDYTLLQMSSATLAAGIGGLLIGGAFAYKCIPAIKERLCSGNDAHPPVETPRNHDGAGNSDDPEVGQAESDPMLPPAEMQCSDEFKTSLVEKDSTLSVAKPSRSDRGRSLVDECFTMLSVGTSGNNELKTNLMGEDLLPVVETSRSDGGRARLVEESLSLEVPLSVKLPHSDEFETNLMGEDLLPAVETSRSDGGRARLVEESLSLEVPLSVKLPHSDEFETNLIGENLMLPIDETSHSDGGRTVLVEESLLLEVSPLVKLPHSDESKASLAEDEKELDPMLTTDETARSDELQASLAEDEKDFMLSEQARVL